MQRQFRVKRYTTIVATKIVTLNCDHDPEEIKNNCGYCVECGTLAEEEASADDSGWTDKTRQVELDETELPEEIK